MRRDKISDVGIGEDGELCGARFLQPGWRFLKSFVHVAGMAHQFCGSFRQIVEKLDHAFLGHFAGLGDAAEIIGRGDTDMMGLLARVASEEF